MDVGPAKLRRRGVAGYTTWPMSMLIRADQRGLFLDFFRISCLEGSLAFDWRNPVTGAPATFRWVGVPTIRPLAMRLGGSEPYLVTFTLEELPSISNAVIVPPGQPEMPVWLLVRDEDEYMADEDGAELQQAAGIFAGSAGSTGGPTHIPVPGDQPFNTDGGGFDQNPGGDGSSSSSGI
jgi:hypothetical protein